MSVHDDWQDWSAQWQQQPVVDVAKLRRTVIHRRRRMIAALAFETLVSLMALGQTVWLLAHPGIDLRWKLFGIGGIVLVTVVWAVSLWFRRGTWRAAGERVADLLCLEARRASASIRLIRLQLWGLGVLLAGSTVLAWPYLQPSAWIHDAALRRLLVLQIGANAPVVIGGIAFSLWYIRRQRRRHARIARMQADLGMDGSAPD